MTISTVTQDETFTGGLCLVASDPVINFIILEQLAEACDQETWNDLMAPALAQLNCEVMYSSSSAMENGIESVKRHAPEARVEDLTVETS